MTDKIRVLYAEDNSLDADLTRAHFDLHAPEFKIEIVASGALCLARVQQQSYDVLLLDNHLPDMDGSEVLQALAPAGAHPPVVMVTGVGDDELVVRTLRLGASDYVPKHSDYLTTLPGILRSVVSAGREKLRYAPVVVPGPRALLYVEPNRMDADMTVRHLAEAAPHLRLTVAPASAQALALLAQPHEFDLVMTDLRTPGMSALEFLREANHRGIALPFIVITGRGDEETAVATLKLGAYDYIVKREGYLTQLPYAIDNAIHRHELDRSRRRLHAELAALNQSLERKVRERTAELEREIAERKRAEEERERLQAALHRSELLAALGSLVAGVAHEARNPLFAISGTLDAFDARFGRQPEYEDYRSVLRRELSRLNELMRDLLDYGRPYPVPMSPAPIAGVIAEAIEACTALAKHAGVELAPPSTAAISPAPVVMDQARLRQVFQNLVQNAIQVSPRGAVVSIEVRTLKRGPRPHLECAIKDAGPGFQADDLPRLFEPFFSRRRGGTGLGLAIAQRIIEDHGGTIAAANRPEGGAVLTVCLPCA